MYVYLAAYFREAADVSVLVTKRLANGAADYEEMNLSAFYNDFDSEEWILDSVLSSEQLEQIQVLLSHLSLLDSSVTFFHSCL